MSQLLDQYLDYLLKDIIYYFNSRHLNSSEYNVYTEKSSNLFIILDMPPKTKAKQAKIQAKKAQNQPKGKAKDDSTKKDDPKSKSKAKQPVSKPSVPTKNVSKTVKSPAAKSKAPSPPKKASSPPKDPPKRGAPVADDTKDAAKGVKKTKSAEQLVKVITKGGAAVDSLVPNKDSFRVYQEGGKIFSATLNQANLDQNNNKFYIIQVLLNESTGNFHVWNRWGRVGVPGQNALKGPMPKDNAVREFNNKHNEKVVKGDYRQIQIKYDDEEEKKEEKKPVGKDKKQVKSKMDDSLQKLISLIFDVNIMNNTMKEIGYDAKKMPLGRLGQSTIKEAYGVLSKLSDAIKKKDRQAMTSLSGDFYSLIPHDFGFQKMSNFILDNDQKVKQKIKMLETISDLKITSKLLDQKTDDNESIMDQNYKKLGCSIKTIDPKTPQFQLLNQYFDNTKGCYGKVQISDAFEVVRSNEQKEFNTKLGNNMLLWHGSRVSNFVGILSQGLRIAPPEAPVSGYLFGKGIYLADMAEKSINYCRSHGQDSALILLIEGALGEPNILLNSNYNAKEDMEKNKKHSTKCHGAKAPPPSSYVKHKEVIVPKGVPQPTNSGSYMGHNEFIIYNMSQARIKYVLRMNMNGN